MTEKSNPKIYKRCFESNIYLCLSHSLKQPSADIWSTIISDRYIRLRFICFEAHLLLQYGPIDNKMDADKCRYVCKL